MTPHISIVIPSYNSWPKIAQCLTALQEQKTSFPYEVIVVDSSADGSAARIRRKFPWVRLLHQTQQAFPGKARNLGVTAAKGELVAFVDSKIVLPKHWVERACRLLRDPHIDSVIGMLRPEPLASLITTSQFYAEFFDFAGSKERQVRYAPTANFACRRADLQRKPFPESLRRAEDTLFFYNQWNKSILLTPSLVATYLGDQGLWEAVRHLGALGWWSGLVRTRHILPGSWLIRSVVLSPTVWFYRCYRYLMFVHRNRPCVPVSTIPVVCVLFVFWTLGLVAASIKGLGFSLRRWQKSPDVM